MSCHCKAVAEPQSIPHDIKPFKTASRFLAEGEKDDENRSFHGTNEIIRSNIEDVHQNPFESL